MTKMLSGPLCLCLLLAAPVLGVPDPPAAAPESTPSLTAKDDQIILTDKKRTRHSVLAPGQEQGVRAVSGGGLKEGRPLEVLLWGGGGAIVGSLAGPVGTVIGAAVGSLIGIAVGTVMPRKQKAPDYRG
jgi:hypothetical protein